MKIEVSKEEARMLCEALRIKAQALTKKADEATNKADWRDLLELANDYDALCSKVEQAIGDD